MFHGHGVGIDDSKENILRYSRLVDQGLHGLLRDQKTPLVFAGTEFLFPIYREANTYPYLLDQAIEGNPEGVGAQELQQKAWNIIEPYILKERQEAVNRYREFIGTGRASKETGEIVRAAYAGRVECLFVAVGVQQWGRFDPASDTVHLEKRPGDGEDLLDLAAMHTLLTGGSVYAVEQENMPDEASIAAVFRF
jgi:hypothetical protein